MNNPISSVIEAINSGFLNQEMVHEVSQHPVIHFSDHARKILEEGFRFGETKVTKLDYTYNEDGRTDHHREPGFNFAFSAIEFDIENDCMDYEVSNGGAFRNFQGMSAERALLFNADGIYTRHYDEFHQVIFWGQDADLSQVILLEEAGELEVDGDPLEDEYGEPLICWTAKTSDGVEIVSKSQGLSLRRCVLASLLHMEKENALSSVAVKDIKDIYQEEIERIDETPKNTAWDMSL